MPPPHTIDTDGPNFNIPGDDSRDDPPVVEEDTEPEEPIPGVLCVPKTKSKQYENSVSSTHLLPKNIYKVCRMYLYGCVHSMFVTYISMK